MSSFKPSLQVLEDRCIPATRIWDGGGLNNNWTNNKNWAGDIAPVAGDDLVFPSNAPDKTTDNNFNADTLFNSITVAGGYTQRGARVLLGSGGLTSSGSSNVIKHKINLSSTRTFNINTGSTLFIDDDIVGNGGLVKAGGGNLSFRNNNSYAGITDIQAGILFVERDNSLGSTAGGTVVRNGATLLFNDQIPLSVIRTDEVISLDGGTIRAINDVELRGNITTLSGGTLKHDGGTLERLLVTGQISGVGGITIANGTGQVLFRGTSANTYQGLTTVTGKMRLENSGGSAVSGNMTITATGRVRFDNDNQIGNTATVTVQAGGLLLTNEKDDSFHRLVLQGGEINGDRLRLNDFSPAFIVGTVGNIVSAIPLLNTFVADRESDIFLNELTATSTSAQAAAKIVDLSIVLNSVDGLVTVNNGPATNDLLVFGTLFSLGSNQPGDNIVTLVGNGKTLLQDFPADRYFINGGELQIAKFKRELITPTFDSVEITVGAGARFTGDVLIEDLHVLAGGRVRPGPFNRPTLNTAIFVQLRSGILGVSGDLTLDPGAILEVQLNGAIAGVNHEQIDVTNQVAGAVNLNGAIIEATLGSGARIGQNYRIINNGGIDAITGLVALPPSSFLIAQPTGQSLSVNHAGGLLNNDLVLTLQNTPPMAPDLVLDQTVIDEGGFVTASGHLVDPDPAAQLRLLINWGDGTPVQTVTPGRADFTFRHRYQQDGQYVASFLWLDQFGQGNSREFEVTVNNVAPQLQFGHVRNGSGLGVVLAGFVKDLGADLLSLTVDYGDGTTEQTMALGKKNSFLLPHHFPRPGTYSVTVTLRDGDGGETALQRQVTI